MDETQSSRASDAAASRKRRSSILKSQRAPRTPFSELEFNVATPTDVSKSRRVSFSRRTGVAEFVTNEATTTWKNFYEEHNKSLESSGNESGANAARPSISHIGKRIFDQQFEEVEAVDFGSAMIPGNSRAAEFNISINNVNLTQQLAALESTVDDKKLTAPQQHFELSSLTDHQSKVFSDDLTIPVMGELSNQINVNFSIMNPMSIDNDKCDDLDEIQKDLERSHNVVCPGPFREQNMSDYIEVDLNITHVAVANDESDMSVTDTVNSPKVEEVSSAVSINKLKQSVMDKDWTTDKENIAVLNPYVAPRESDNFAVNEVPDQVLVFDGKRLTVQTEKQITVITDEAYCRQTMPFDAHKNIPQRKTIVLNTNDDLPNFRDERILRHRQDAVSVSAEELKHTMIFDEGHLSMTQTVQNIVEPSQFVELSSKRKEIICGNTSGNVSVTQAVPSNVILDHNVTREMGKTIIYDNSYGNISMTQAISANVLLDIKSDSINNRRTTMCDRNNVSFTDIPENLIPPKNSDKSSNKTVLFENNMEDVSFTQVIPTNIHLEKSQINETTVFERSVCNISMTQALPSNIILCDSEPVSNRRKTIIYENVDADISMTQAIHENVIITEKSQIDEYVNNKNTVKFENDTAKVSLTGTLQGNIVQQEVCNKSYFDIVQHKSNDKLPSDDLKEINALKADSVDLSIDTSKNIPNRRLTILYDEHADISKAQALPNHIIMSSNPLIKPNERKSTERNLTKGKEVIGDEICSVSGMQSVPNNVIFQEENEVTILSQVCQNENKSTTPIVSNQSEFALTSMIIQNDEIKTVNELKPHILANTKHVINLKDTAKSEIGNFSMSKPIPDKIGVIENEMLKKDIEKFTDLTQFGENTLLQDTIHEKSNVDILVYQAKTQETSEILTRKSEHDCDDLKQNDSKLSIEIEKMVSTTAGPVESLNTIGNNSENMKEKECDTQINLQNEEELLAGNLKATSASGKISQDIKGKKSILHELLDMTSNPSVGDDIADKNIAAQVDTEILQDSKKSTENNSYDAIFIITEDKDENNQIDIKNVNSNLSTAKKLNFEKNNEVQNKSLPALECNIEKENYLEDKLLELKRTINEKKNSPPQNRHYEKIVSSDLQASFNQDVKDISDVKDPKTRKSFKEADDTKELLEIISDFTDRKYVVPIQDDDKVVPQIKLRRSMALEHKAEVPEPRRLSFAPNRQSIVLTREELLNNLSMAQATLQQSRFDIEDSEVEDTATESPTEINESVNSPKKSVRMSNEVVKTLNFEDESCSDVSLKSDVKVSPLKKTAFGETSYMKDCKSNVIPTYLKDVSDNIKALMNDLVKPRPDQMPFEVIGIPKTKKQPSTCSTHIQANLITSSQIDLDVEHLNFVDSESLIANTSDIREKAIGRALKGNISAATDTPNDVGKDSHAAKYYEGKPTLKKDFQEPVLVFDHQNPLNNVLLAPPNCVDVHKYNPKKSSHALIDEENPNMSKNVEETIARIGKQFGADRFMTQYNVENLVGLQSGDACPDKKGDSNSLYSDSSKPLSMDRSTEGFTMEVKNTEVNTVIAMKGNKELLEASSSLTLVDDALTQNVFDIKVGTRPNDQNSPVKVIYKNDGEDVSMLQNMDSDFLSNDDEPMEYPKTRKRSYSPSPRDVTRSSTISSPDVTPKPVSKMQKLSTSPLVHDNLSDDRDDSTEASEKPDKRSSRKSKGSPKYKKPGTDLTVQQLITEYKITKMEQNMIEEQIIEAIHDRMSLSQNELDTHKISIHSPDGMSSCTSSKDENEMQDNYVKQTVSYVGSQPSRVDWQPDLKELRSKHILTECDSGVNVVAKIDMLPFMGSKECEWETSGGDTWVFRLLRARLRLRVRLAHRHHNALRTCVRADTPVTEISVDAVPVEDKDPLAQLCVRFAAEAMRYECGRGCARAGDVPLTLRRCGGVARVALRWARAMRDARTRLAYTLTADGLLTLKVANIPLRSVWEVSMRLELVVEDAREAAWPRAGGVRVRRVLADCAVGGDETARALHSLSHDWGHAPRTIWKIFRYLKNKTREDDFLSL